MSQHTFLLCVLVKAMLPMLQHMLHVWEAFEHAHLLAFNIKNTQLCFDVTACKALRLTGSWLSSWARLLLC